MRYLTPPAWHARTQNAEFGQLLWLTRNKKLDTINNFGIQFFHSIVIKDLNIHICVFITIPQQ